MARRVERAEREYDLVIAGAGPVGCVLAERASAALGWSVLIVERRSHIAGNCYDSPDEDGILLHCYGPHYFRTNDDALLAYLSRFTDWIPGNYVVKSSVDGELFPFPINLTTLEQFFGVRLDDRGARALLEAKCEPITAPKNSEELVLSRVGRELYEAFYLGYTLKQWGRHPRELAPSVCGRIPVRLTRDEHYVDAKHRVMPARGYTAMFEAMIAHPEIDLLLDADFFAVGARARYATIYTGPIDRYFDHAHGPLPWRSLEFEHRSFDREHVQPCVQINYPDEHDYTRSVEIKHVTRQQHPRTVVTYEYPRAEGDPFYPVPAPDHDARYQRYRELADRETAERAVYFVGRLAEYTYINTDQAIERALATFDALVTRFDHLWVVMPAYNEEAVIAGVVETWLETLRRTCSRFTLLCVDDGSSDRTPAVLAELAAPELAVLRTSNGGHGRACVAGYRAALAGGAAWVLQVDSDGQCDPVFFEPMWRQRRRHAVQYGFRTKREDGARRTAISRLLAGVVRVATGEHVPDANVPYRLMRTDTLGVLDRIPTDFELANIALAVLQEREFGIAWHDIVFRRRLGGESMFKPTSFVRHAGKLARDLRRL